jgi:hypothetical protein
MKGERGSVLVEFALVSFVLYLMLAAAIDFGRLMFTAQALQDAARVASRELALTPLDATLTLSDALADPGVKARVFDPDCLVIDLTTFNSDDDITAFVGDLPAVNKALWPLMVGDVLNSDATNLRRYPGALLNIRAGAAPDCHGHASKQYVVGIPKVTITHDGSESMIWVPILEAVTTSGGVDPFPLMSGGLSAVRVNYPYQAALLSGFKPGAAPFDQTIGSPIEERPVVPGGTFDPGGDLRVENPVPGQDPEVGPYAGPLGLGRQFAFAGKTIRPYRKLLSAQAVYHREVFQ